MLSVLRAFGFDDFTFNLSTKDPNKYVGTDEIWDEATEALRQALDTHGLEYAVKEGDAAFYGPKIDVDVRDAIGRSWQLSTIQCDFNHPERFDLEYVGADNARHRPIMFHRALFGSIERFFGVLARALRRRVPDVAGAGAGAGAAGGRAPTRSTPSRSSRPLADGRRSASTSVTADDQLGKRIRARQAGEDAVRARRRRRRRRRRARSASTRVAARSSAACRVDEFVAGCAPRSPTPPTPRCIA